MKITKLFNVIAIGLALTCVVATGCKKKPSMITPMAERGGGPKTGNVGDVDPAKPIDLGPTGTNTEIGGPGGTPLGDARDRVGWKENKEALQAETIHFAFDSAAVRADDKSKLENVASYLKSNAAEAVRIEGNCDDRGTEEYNRALGERRALAGREELIKLGIAADRIETKSWGKDNPANDPGRSEAAYAKNRRGDFVVLSAP
jgi:outer membrane protein OmpA-like peptidoglycan-associated protein